MKINSTDYTYCTVTDIDVTGLTAKLSLLMYSSSPQVTRDKNNNVSRAFCFFTSRSGMRLSCRLI